MDRINHGVRKRDGGSEDVTQPLPLPKHVSNLAVGGSIATVPEPDMIFLLVLTVITGSLFLICRKLRAAARKIAP